jgi:hypothetical protein
MVAAAIAAIAALACAAAPGSAQTAALPNAKQTVIAPASRFTRSDLQSMPGAAGWLEHGRRVRLVVAARGHVRRSAWLDGVNDLRVHRGVDAATGRAAVRAELWRCAATGECVLRSTRDIRSLRPAPIRWAPEPVSAYKYGVGIGAIVDGDTQLTYRDTPEPRGASADDAYIDRLAPTGCDLRYVGRSDAIPVLHDCGRMVVSVHAGLIAVHATVPSATLSDFYSATSRLDVLDLRSAQPHWRRVGSGRSGKGGSGGGTVSCLLDDGIAVLRGETDSYGPSMPRTWRLSVLPLRAGGASWVAATPWLAGMQFEGMVCTERDVYAIRVTDQAVVRISRPSGAPLAGDTVS